MKKPNLLCIISDDTDPRYLGCYGGSNLTPNLDRLAREGTRFNEAHVVSPMCVPGRYCYLTGQYPHRSRPFLENCPADEPYRLPLGCDITPDQETLATVLKRQGYRTGYVGKYHNFDQKLGAIPGTRPLEYLPPDDPRDTEIRRGNQAGLAAYLNRHGWDYAGGITFGNLDGPPKVDDYSRTGGWSHNLEWQVEAGLDFLDGQAGESDPFCLYFSTNVIHGPEHSANIADLDPRMTYGGLLDAAPDTPMPSRQSILERLRAAGLEPNHRNVGILWQDDAVGVLLARLEAMGELDNTIVVYKADHGVIGKWTCFDDGTRVPHIWRLPDGTNAGGLCRQRIQNIDFLPTIAEVCGFELPADMPIDGSSYAAQLRGSQEPVHEATFTEMGYQRSLRTDRYKLILNYQHPEVIRRMRDGEVDQAANTQGRFKIDRGDQEHAAAYDPEQLYDLRTDPEEQLNLADRPEYAEVLAEMKGRLRTLLDTLERPYPGEPDPYLLSEDYRRLVRHTRETKHCYDIGPWYPEGWF